MAYRNLHFTSLAKDLAIRTETYNGEEHLVVPCVALVGDEVVYGMNAEGPEFIPAEELEYSTLGWSGRPVLPDHPANSTSTANDPRTLELMQFGQIFYPKFEDGKLKVEAWLGRDRAKKVEGAEKIISRIENEDEVIELSVGAIISLEKRNGISPSGKKFQAVWHDVQSDHLAIGLSGSEGACNIEMGCGANRVLKSANGTEPENGVRMMRAIRGVNDMPTATAPDTDTPATTEPAPATEPEKVTPRSAVRKILSFASKLFRSNTEDEGLSDSDLRNKLWDILYSVEPAFYGIDDVFQESMTVNYVTQPTVPTPTLYLWRRTFTIADDGAVAINDDREEVSRIENSYMYLSASPADRGDSAAPCGCHKALTGNETDNDNFDSTTEDPNMADAPNTTITTPVSTSGTTPVPSTPTTPTTPTVPATPTTPTTPDPAPANEPAKELTEEEKIALLPADVQAMVRHYRAQEQKERANLITALGKKQKVYTAEELGTKPTEDLRKLADLAGLVQAAANLANTTTSGADYSGRVLVSADEEEIKPVPDSWAEARKLRKQREDAQGKSN